MRFSEHLVFKKGSAEYLLKDPIILVTNGETIPKAEASGRPTYDNLNIKNFVERLINEVGNEDLPTLRTYVPQQGDTGAEIEEFCCPITLTPMSNPVVAVDGVTYEREALEHWLNGPTSQGRTPLRGRMVNPNGERLPMPQNKLLSTLITEHAAQLQHDGIEYEIGVDFTEFDPGRWAEFLERAKLRFTAAIASGLLVTIELLKFLDSLESSMLLSITAGTTSILVGTTVGSAAFTLSSAINTIDAILTSTSVLTDSTSSSFFSPGSGSVSSVPACSPGNG